MELNFFLSALVISTQFAISFPIGFLILSEKMKEIPFIIKMPIYMSLGLIIITILLFIFGIIIVHQYILITIGIVSYVLFFYRLLKIKNKVNLNFSTNVIKKNYITIVSLFFFFLVFLHFSLVSANMGWPPQGDITHHGLYTSLIDYNGKIEGTLSPLSQSAIRAPLGLHTLSASNSSLFGIFPGESFFLMGTSIIILITLTIFSTTFILTKSLSLSSVAIAATFYIHPTENLLRWIIGYYYNGPYPNMYGYLVLIMFIIFWLVLPKNQRNDKKFFIIIITIIFGVLIIYPPFVILPGLFILIELIIKFLRNRKLFEKHDQIKHSSNKKKKILKTHFFQMSIFFIPLASLDILIIEQIKENLNAVKDLAFTYHLSFNEYFVDYAFILVLLSLTISCIFILKRKYLRLSLFYFIFTSILVFSTNENIFEQLWFLLAGRLFAFLFIFSWVITLLGIKELIIWKFNKNNPKIFGFITNYNLSKLVTVSISLILISVFFFNPIMSHATFDQAQKWGWFTNSESFQNDYDMHVWISKNIQLDELIMTDYSHTSRFIHSFSIQNVTANKFDISDYEKTRSIEGQLAWNEPQNFPHYLQKYDINYVFLNSEWGYKDPTHIGGDNRYHEKKYNVKQYGLIFSEFSFLEEIKKIGESSVYKVLKPELNKYISNQEKIYSFPLGWWEWQTDESSGKFTILSYDDEQLSVKFNNESNTPAYLKHHFSNKIKQNISKELMWINLSVIATNPSVISLVLEESSDDSYGYIVRIDENKLKSNKIENITIPIMLPNWGSGTPEISQLESLLIKVNPSTSYTEVTFHKLDISK